MAVKIIWTGPRLSGRGSITAMKRVLDGALVNHRRRFLPGHFTKSAFARYPNEYRQSGKNAKFRRGQAFGAKLRAASPAERRKIFENIKKTRMEQARLRRNGRADTKNEIPLVLTGRGRGAILSGFVRFTGPVDRRSMVLQPPFYWFFNPPKQINKVLAVEAVRESESDEFTRVADGLLQQFLDTNTEKIKNG